MPTQLEIETLGLDLLKVGQLRAGTQITRIG
jgi:hypothetical protein